MGTIYSGVGLISGLDYDSIIEQLIAIEARPRDRLLARIGSIDAQRTAYLDISARISAILSRVSTLAQRSFFTSAQVSSSSSDVLSVTAGEDPVPGSYNLIVRALATTHQLVSRGFRASDAQLSPALLTIESARARINARTRLEELNGYSGVQRGSFQIIDGEDNEATINISDAVTLADVVSKINEAELNVRAEVRGDGLVLTETTGGPLRVREVNDEHVAADLGFGPGRRSDPGGRIVGGALIYLGENTPVCALNDGNGIRRARAGGDFSINGITIDLSGLIKGETRIERLNHGQGVNLGRIRVTSVDDLGREQEQEIDLRGLDTVGQIKDVIEGSVEELTVTLTDNRLVVAYRAGDDDKLLRIEDIDAEAAHDLGIEGESESGKIDGRGILHVDRLADVVSAVNYASENDGSVSASLDGTRLVIEGGATVDLVALGDSKALFDLGFDEGTQSGPAVGGRVIGGIDSTLLSSLNGGEGFEPGRINIQVGTSNVILDLSSAETLRDVIEMINDVSQAEELDIEAGFDHTGTRLVINSIDGLTEILISDVVGHGTFAADTGLAQEQASPQVRSNNLQRQYVWEATELAELNNGRGVTLGKIRITNSLGVVGTVDLSEGQVETLQDVIDQINGVTNASGDPLNVTARINDTGDGLLIEDTAGGELALIIEDESGTAARDLNLLGQSEEGLIDGSYQMSIEISGSDTLEDLVSRINDQGGLASASLLNDGTEIAPYRLQISSTTSGSAGELLVDGLDFTTLSAAQDARVVLGTNADSGVLVTSSSNTLTDVVPGLTIELVGISDDPVTVSVSRDLDTIIETFQGLVSSFNEAIDRIDEVGGYDAETETRGILLGEGTLQLVERRLFRMITRQPPGAAGNIRRPSDVGIRIRNGKLEFEEDRFREAFENDTEEVIRFFTDEESGLGEWMKQQLEGITDTGGLIDRREGSLDRQKELINDRVEQLNERLERKRERLMRQFAAVESALAELQSQQDVLAQLAALAGSFGGLGVGSGT